MVKKFTADQLFRNDDQDGTNIVQQLMAAKLYNVVTEIIKRTDVTPSHVINGKIFNVTNVNKSMDEEELGSVREAVKEKTRSTQKNPPESMTRSPKIGV